MYLTLSIILKSSVLIHRPEKLFSNYMLTLCIMHSVHHAHKLTTTRCALEKSICCQDLGLEQGVACHPLDGGEKLSGSISLLFLY